MCRLQIVLMQQEKNVKIDERFPVGKIERRKLSESRGVSLAQINVTHKEDYGATRNDRETKFVDTPVTQILTGADKFHFSGDQTTQEPRHAILDLCVFLPGGKGIHFSIENGCVAPASDVQHLVNKQLQISEPHSSAFSLWMISPRLELQLKPHHVPFAMRCAWPSLLKKYTDIRPDELECDEPLLMHRRSVTLSRRQELQILNSQWEDGLLIDLLYEDAKSCVLTGKYFTPSKVAIQLACRQLAIELGAPNDRNLQKAGEMLPDCLPAHWYEHLSKRTQWPLSLVSCSSPQQEVLEEYRLLSLAETDLITLKIDYIKQCMELPSYGGALFKGKMEQPHQLFGLRSGDLEVDVVISPEFLTIVSVDKKTLLLTVQILDCVWDVAVPPKMKAAQDYVPILFLSFPSVDTKGDGQLLVQIFSKQAVFIDALLHAFLQCLLDSEPDDCETDLPVEGTDADSKMRSWQQDEAMMNKLDKICCATFVDGNLVSATGSLKKYYSVQNAKSSETTIKGLQRNGAVDV